MIPTLSNTSEQGCSPVSSNCVIWQGPDLPSINLCKGDTVSDVVYKLANYLVESGNAQLDIDLSCITTAIVTDMSVDNILTLLVNKVCTIQDLVNDLGSGDTVPDPLLTIAQCFRTTDAYGDVQTRMQHTAYTSAIGLKVCDINTTVTSHSSTLASYGNRITVLEAAVSAPTAQVSLSLTCSGTNSPMSLSNAILNLESQICTLRSATGTSTAITQAAAAQCVGLSTANALSTNGTMSSIPGWKTQVSTLADSINNLWLTICDMRGLVSNGGSLVNKDCTAVTVDFVVALINGGTAANLFFSGYSSIPAGYTNCTGANSVLTITDTLGNTFRTNIDVVGASNSSNPVSIQLDGTPLNLSTALTFSLAACVTNGTYTCSKSVVKNVGNTGATCPALTITAGPTLLSYSFVPTLTNNTVYKVVLMSSTGTELNSKTYASPQSVVSDSFTGLTGNTSYKIKVVVTVGTASPVECATSTYTTLDPSQSSGGTCVAPTNVSATLT